MKKLLPVAALVALVAVFILLAAGAALACPRAHPVLVMNVTYKVTNDEASGNVGYWALRDYTRHVQVWRMPDGSFSWESRFEGRWTTFAGALSPGAGVPQAADGWGRFEGVLNGTFTSDPYTPVRGYLGTHDAGGTRADVLLPPDQQAGTPDVWSPGDTYFLGAAADKWGSWVTTAYSYTYRYRHQTFVWDGFAGTSTGDIVITN